jgi:adenylyltransferase/sulfurtransferase
MNRAPSSFAVIGAGGLGCPALLGLAAAGAARIALWDPDRVETSNLQRQVLYASAHVGMPKVEAAAAQLRGQSPDLRVETHRQRIDPENVDALLADLPPDTIVLECTDQPRLKFAFNDRCLARGVPLVIGAALGGRGQAMAVLATHACYRCIYEAPPPSDRLASCAEAGVLGSAVGLAGFLMAQLAVALTQGRTNVAGVLFALDVWSGRVQRLAPGRRTDCPACRAPINDLDRYHRPHV